MENNEEKVEQETTNEVVQQEVTIKNTEQQTQSEVQTEALKQNTPPEVPSEPKKEKKKNKKALIVILVVLIVLLSGAGVYYFVFRDKTTKTNKLTTDKKDVYSEYRMSGNSLEKFDLAFLKLENEEKNKVYSPLSIKYALEMLSEGTNGETKKQLDAIIGDYKAKKYTNNEHMSFANAMFIRNSFASNIKDDYIKTLKEKYDAEVIYDPFENPNNINSWVKNKTLNLIDNLLDSVDNNTFFLVNALAIDMNWKNQIHCTADHKIPCVNNGMYSINYNHEILDESAERPYGVVDYPYDDEEDFFVDHYEYNNGVQKIIYNKFNGKEKTKAAAILVDVNKYDIVKDLGEDKIKEILRPEYESWLKTEEGKNDLPVEEGLNKFIDELKKNYGKNINSTDFLFYTDDNVKAFAKDLQEYEGTTLQYIGIMPTNEELTKYVKNIDEKEINKIIKELKEVKYENFEEGYVTKIRGSIPLFKFEYELNLLEDLKKLGVEDVFDKEKADLSNMCKEGDNYIGEAIHKANIEFSNDGIKASAVTVAGGYGAATGPYFEHLFKVPVKEIDLTFDKPYMYIIRDKESGEVWFTGTVYEPIQKQ